MLASRNDCPRISVSCVRSGIVLACVWHGRWWQRCRLPRVTPWEPALGQCGGEAFDVLHCQIEGRDADAQLGDWFPEIDPNASPIRAAKRQVVLADAEADADRGDPAPRAFDPPRGEVARRGPEPKETEMRIELVVGEIDVGIRRPDPEQQEDESRPPAEVDREPLGHHRGGPFRDPAPLLEDDRVGRALCPRSARRSARSASTRTVPRKIKPCTG